MTLSVYTRPITKVVRKTHVVAIAPDELRLLFAEHMYDLVDQDILERHKFPIPIHEDPDKNAHKLRVVFRDDGYLEVQWDEYNEP